VNVPNGNEATLSATELTPAQKEAAGYIADISHQLANTSRQVQLSFLAHLLEMAYYEAYRLARGEAPTVTETERQR
jgi:hypothetical protein